MAEDTPEVQDDARPGQRVVRIRRFQIGLNVLLQLAVLMAILGMVNYLSFHHFRRWDFSRNQKYVLSEQTHQVLGNLKQPVKAIVLFSGATEIYADLASLLREYEFASKKQFQTETVDPYRNFSRARELQSEYKFNLNENLLILSYDGRNKFVSASDMAEIDQSGIMAGQPPTIKSFKGEQVITSALIELTEGKPNQVYLLTGHGEPDPEANPQTGDGPARESVKAFRTFLERQNVKVGPLKLAEVEKVPDDARLVVLIAPKYDLSDREMKILRNYWGNNGRLLISLDPGAKTPRLTAFLEENGLRPQDDRVLLTRAMGNFTGILRDVTGEIKGGSALTRRMVGLDTQFHGQTQSLAIDSARAQSLGVTVTSLIEAPKDFWGETDYQGGEGSPVYFDPKKDHAGPLPLAASVEKGALADRRVSVETSRMVVISNGDFLKDDGLTQVGLDFALASVNWLLNREEIIGIAPKEKQMFTLDLKDQDLLRIFLTVLVGIPGLVAIFGIATWWQRRS